MPNPYPADILSEDSSTIRQAAQIDFTDPDNQPGGDADFFQGWTSDDGTPANVEMNGGSLTGTSGTVEAVLSGDLDIVDLDSGAENTLRVTGLTGTAPNPSSAAAQTVEGDGGHGLNLIGTGQSGNGLAGVFVNGSGDEGIALQGNGAAGVGLYAVLLGSTNGAVIQAESTAAGSGLQLEVNGAGAGAADLLVQLNGTGLFVIANLPASDPHVAGAVYSGAAGALFISAG